MLLCSHPGTQKIGPELESVSQQAGAPDVSVLVSDELMESGGTVVAGLRLSTSGYDRDKASEHVQTQPNLVTQCAVHAVHAV